MANGVAGFFSRVFYGVPVDSHEVLLCGHNRMGYHILKKLQKLRKNVMVVDWNPEVVSKLRKENVASVRGNVGSQRFLSGIDLSATELCISTVPSYKDNVRLLRHFKNEKKNVPVILTAQSFDDAMKLYKEGAHYVIMPHYLGGKHVSLLMEDFSVKNFVSHRRSHLKEIVIQKKRGHM